MDRPRDAALTSSTKAAFCCVIVEIDDHAVDLADRCRLRLAAVGKRVDELGDIGGAGHDPLERLMGLAHHLHTVRDFLAALADQVADVLGGFRRALGERADLVCDDRGLPAGSV
jgi:hypothetical protein